MKGSPGVAGHLIRPRPFFEVIDHGLRPARSDMV